MGGKLHPSAGEVLMTDLDQALVDVEAGRVERVCAPGKWVVWRDGEMVFSKVTNTESDPGSWADAIAHSPCSAVSDYVPPEEAG